MNSNLKFLINNHLLDEYLDFKTTKILLCTCNWEDNEKRLLEKKRFNACMKEFDAHMKEFIINFNNITAKW